MQNGVAAMENAMKVPQKNKKLDYYMIQHFHFLVYIQKNQNQN